MKNIIVTGARGLLGSHLVDLLARDHRVFALGRGAPEQAEGNVVPIVADLSRPLDAGLLPERIDSVVYLAQSRRFREFPEGAADVRQINVDQPLALIEAARQRGAGAFVYASTGSVYAASDEPLREESPLGASGFYAASKRAAELLLEPYEALMSVAALRFFFIYGPGQKSDMLIPRLIGNVREGRPVTLQGESGLILNPIHARDAARAVAAALDLPRGGVINVAGPESLSIRELCDLAGRKLGRDPVYEVDAKASAPRLAADISRMKALLGEPTIRFEEALAELV